MCNCVWYVFPHQIEQSQDSVAIMSDCSSLQDVFMDPTSSQDSNPKGNSGKCLFPEESNAAEKEKQAQAEDTGKWF